MGIIIKVIRVFLIGLIFFLMIIPIPTYSQDTPTVEVEIGPIMDDDDRSEIEGCLTTSFTQKFPLDFILEEPEVSTGCPNLEIFDNTYEACFITEIYRTIEPAILGGLIIYGIFHL